MNGNSLGRERVWSADVWGEIDRAVKAEVASVRVAQKVFPAFTMPGATVVPADEVDFTNMTIAEGEMKPLMEISVEFSLSQSQVENESSLRSGRTLARLAAKSVAMAEDLLIVRGKDKAAPIARNVHVVNRDSAGNGLLLLAAKSKTLSVDRKDGEYPHTIFGVVAEGISFLVGQGQPGPYALILAPSIFADANRPTPATLVTPADRIGSLVPGGFYACGALLEPSGLLVSLGGEPVTVYIGTDAVTAYTQSDSAGRSLFRVFERVQVVCRDPSALVKLEFVN